MAISWDKPEELCLTPSSGSTWNLQSQAGGGLSTAGKCYLGGGGGGGCLVSFPSLLSGAGASISQQALNSSTAAGQREGEELEESGSRNSAISARQELLHSQLRRALEELLVALVAVDDVPVDEYFIQQISHRFVANPTPEAVLVAVDVQVLYDDLGAVPDLPAAVTARGLAGPVQGSTGQVTMVAASLQVTQIHKAATAVAGGGRKAAGVHVLLDKEDPSPSAGVRLVPRAVLGAAEPLAGTGQEPGAVMA